MYDYGQMSGSLASFATRASAMGDDELRERLGALDALQRRLDAERLGALAEWDARQVWADDGSTTGVGRLARDASLSRREARDRLRLASLLRSSMPATAAAFGELGASKAKVLSSAINDRTSEAFADCEARLVEEAKRLSVDQLAVLVNGWRRLVDQDGANADADAMHERQFFQLSKSWAGEGFLSGRLAPEGAAIVDQALELIAGELRDAEKAERAALGADAAGLRAASQRYAEALVEMAARSMANTAAADAGQPVAPARPLITVVIDLDAAEGVDLDEQTRAMLAARLPGGVTLPPADAVRVACDAALSRLVASRGTVPLHLGRSTRDPSDAQRRALAALWDGCAFDGCTSRYAWCDLHHVHHWEAGGPTDVDWLLPLCRRHHRLHHQGVFRIRRQADGTFVFTRPDGQPIFTATPTGQLAAVARRLGPTAA